jgi:hypothetical protein
LFVRGARPARPGRERRRCPLSPFVLASHVSAFNPWILVVLLALALWVVAAGAVRLLRAVSREALWVVVIRRLLGR